MAASWNFIDPLQPLTSFSVVPIAGGSQAAETYDFMAVVTNATGNFRFGATVEGPPLYANNVVLDGTQGIRITVGWDASHGAGYKVYFWYKLSSASNWWNGGLLPESSWVNYIVNPATQMEMDYFIGSSYQVSVASTNGTPFGFAKDEGAGVIQLYDDWGSGYLNNVFADMESQGKANTNIAQWNGHNSFHGYWGIEGINTLAGSINCSYLKLWVLAFDFGLKITDGHNFTIKAIPSAANCFDLYIPFYAGSATFCNFHSADLKGITISEGTAGFPSGGWGSMQLGTYGTTKIRDSRIHCSFPKLYGLDMFSGTHLYCSQLLVYIDSENYIEPFYLHGVLRLSYAHFNTWFDGLQLYGNLPYQIDYWINYSGTTEVHKFKDCKFYNTDPDTGEIIKEQDYPIGIYWRYIALQYHQMLHIEHTLKFRVVNKDGSEMDQVGLKIYDKDENLVHDLITDVNGEIEQILITKEITYVGTTDGFDPAYTNIEEKAPFRFVFTKQYYHHATYHVPSITEALAWDVIMQDEVEYVEGLINADVEEDVLTGSVVADELTGVMATEVIAVDVEEDTISGEVSEEKIYITIE